MSDKFAILGMLKDEDLHGYEISRRLKNLEGFWYIFPGNLYRALNSLESEGFIVAKELEEHQGKFRKIYRITEEGRKSFADWISQPAKPPRTRHEAYLKIWLAREDEEKVRVQLEQIRDYSREILQTFENAGDLPMDTYLGWMLDVGMKHVKLDLEWSEKCLTRLTAGKVEGRDGRVEDHA